MSTDRHPKGIPAGGQFAASTHAEPDVSLVPAEAGLVIKDGPEHDIIWDAPEDHKRFLEAAAFMVDSDIEGTATPLYTQFKAASETDRVLLEVDEHQFILSGVGSRRPDISFGGDENDAWKFRMEPGDGAGQTEYEILSNLVVRARHEAACQDAWRQDEEAFQEGDEYSVRDFGVRYVGDERIITLDLDWDGRGCELTLRGNGDVQIHYGGADAPVSLPHIQLDAIALDFDADHIEGTGDIRFKAMMKDVADRAAEMPGYSPRRL